MIDISVKDLVKSFDEEGNLLDGISFDVQSGSAKTARERRRCLRF